MRDLKHLKELLKLCRSEGVQSLKYEGIEITLGSLPTKNTRKATPKTAVDTSQFDPGQITVDPEMTAEEMLFYSSEPPQESQN